MIRNYNGLTRPEVEQIDGEKTTVFIPLGALKQHGNQAPLGTDDIIAQTIMEYLKEALEARGPDFPMFIFPAIPVGLSVEHKNFCGSVILRPGAYYHTLYDIYASLAHHGFRKLALLVRRGGNAPITQVLSRKPRNGLGASPFILSSGVFSHSDVKATASEGNVRGSHGGKMETSMVMAVDSSLVELETSESGIPATFKDNQSLQPYGPVSIG